MVLAITNLEPLSAAPAKWIADFQDCQTMFESGHTWDGWVGYDFITSSVRPTHYSLRSHEKPYLRAWVLEGTIDGTNWFVLDSRPNNSMINGKFKVGTFEVANPKPCWKIRVKQAGPSKNKRDCQRDYFRLSAFELFGTFYPGDPP
jgi:hypothetical protein